MSTAHSPGKLILAGEHAVLAGCPALVMATPPRVTCGVQETSSGAVRLKLPNRDPVELASKAVSIRAETVQDRHTKGLSPEVPEDLLLTALHRVAPSWSGTITFTTCLPIGSGMGASAACILALLKALHPETPSDTLYDDALQIEHFQHGTSSGIDIWTSLNGGVWWIDRNRREPVTLSQVPDFTLYHTGTPSSTTGECVQQVQRDFPKDHGIWRNFSKVTLKTRHALEQQDGSVWSEAIRENHRYLSEIGVVPHKIQNDIAHIESKGGSAKVCGAGSVSGDAAGVVVVRDAAPDTIPKHWSDIDAGFCTVGTSS